VGSQSCFQCGRHFPPRSQTDFDGFLSVSDEVSEEDMDRILEAMESRSPEDLERDVYQEMGLLL
jgi:hypothetical protein